MQRQYILVRKLLRNIKEITQRAHGVKKTLYWRRCDVITSHRRQPDVVSTSCASWGMDGTNSRLACGSYTETKTVYRIRPFKRPGRLKQDEMGGGALIKNQLWP